MAGPGRDVQKMLRVLTRDHGCEAIRGKGGHWKVTLPGRPPVFLANSPSCPHAIQNMKHDVRAKLGINL